MALKTNLLRSEKGFSLSELIVTLCVAGIFMGIAVPSFSVLTKAQSKRAARESFEAFLKRAQATAMTRGARVILTSRSSGSYYTFGLDYPPYNTPVNPDSTSLRLYLPKNVSITTSQRIIFSSRGQLINSTGAANSSNINMSVGGSSFASATLYSTGALIYN